MSTPPAELLTDDDGLTLTRVHPMHWNALAEAARSSLPELGRWFGWATPDYRSHDTATFVSEAWLAWDRGREFHFAMTVAGVPGIAGMCGLDEISPVRRSGNLGYWVRSDLTGRGLATRATRLVARFGFEQLDLQRIHLFHAVGNDASRRVAEKVGFVQEGRLRGHLEVHGERVDCLTYGMVEASEIRD